MYTANEYIAQSLKAFFKASVWIQGIVALFYLVCFILSFHGINDEHLPAYSVSTTCCLALIYKAFEMGFKKCVFDEDKKAEDS